MTKEDRRIKKIYNRYVMNKFWIKTFERFLSNPENHMSDLGKDLTIITIKRIKKAQKRYKKEQKELIKKYPKEILLGELNEENN